MAGNENGGELLQDAVCRTLAIEMLDGKWPAGESLTLEDVQNRFGISRTVRAKSPKNVGIHGCGDGAPTRRIGGAAVLRLAGAQPSGHRMATPLHAARAAAVVIDRIAIGGRTGCGGLGGAPRLHRRQGEFPVYAAQMRQIAESNEEGAVGLTKFHDLDVEFHTLILRESGNELFAALADTIATVLRGRVELGKYPMKPKPAALDAHDAVADAIAKGDPERARKAMFDIVDEVARALNFF